LTRILKERLEAIRNTGVDAADIGGTSHIVVMQLLESASDVDAAGRAVGEAHRRAVRAFQEGGAGRPVPANDGARTLLRQSPELQTLSVLLKAWLFFVRGFCDNAYRLLLAGVEGRPAKRGGSMENILNPRNPVASLLAREAPSVPSWFQELREIRNDVKRGAAFAFSQLDARGLHLTIFEIRASKSPLQGIEVIEGRTVTFADVVEDAGKVLELMRLLAARQAASKRT
jgi:hypothetical protein